MFTGAKFLDRHALVLSTVTLNGNSARVSGIRNDVATVRDATTGVSAEFAWPTVESVVMAGGAFNA